MMMMELTIEEKAWVKKVQTLLNKCPSKRIAAATIGDNDISLYDTSFDDEICEMMDNENCDFVPSIEKLGCGLGSIIFPFAIHSTAG